MTAEEIKKYWEDRAAHDTSAQSTTNDIYMREIEYGALRPWMEGHYKVADVGCGDGRTTAHLAMRFPDIMFTGYDYCDRMIANARVACPVLHNLRLENADICNELKKSFDLIYTTRCLINLPTWEMQKTAIFNIHCALEEHGKYIMVENFIEGHDNLNRVREQFGLPEIKVRSHNLFFQRDRFLDFIQRWFVLVDEVNISSSYYMTSRTIYSKICADAGIKPDYSSMYHKLASGLPFAGEYGPVRLICLRKRG